MRIGFDITALYVAQAGVFQYDYNLIRALVEHGRDNEYLLLDYRPIHGARTDRPKIQTLEARNARIVHCSGLRHRRLSRWRLVQRPVLQPLAALVDRALLWPWSRAAEAVMRRRLPPLLAGVDVFHSSDILLWRQPGALNVVTIYDLTAHLFPEHHTANTRELQRQKFRFAQQEADVVVAISEATKRDVITYLGISPERVHVVHGGVSRAFRPVENRAVLTQRLAPLGLSPGGYILHVGTVEPRKNLVRLVEAYSRLQMAVPVPVPKLVLAGMRGWQSQEVFAHIEALSLEKEVLYLGEVPTDLLPALYSGALLLAYPSLYEGFGLPPLEAMACGVPVVVSNVSSLPEVVGAAGVLVDPEDVAGLAEAMIGLVNSPGQRSELGQAGLVRARSFSWERAARAVLAVYEGAGASRRAGTVGQ